MFSRRTLPVLIGLIFLAGVSLMGKMGCSDSPEDLFTPQRPVDDGCLVDADCNDGNACTLNLCGTGGGCVSICMATNPQHQCCQNPACRDWPPCAGVDAGVIDVLDYATSTQLSGWCWRGFTFTVSQPVVLTALRGGFEGVAGHSWSVALYEAPDLNMSVQPVGALLASGPLPPSEAFARVEVGPVALQPGQVYLLAQGRVSGGGNHHVVSGFDAAALVLSEPLIDAWSDSAWYFSPCLGNPADHPGVSVSADPWTHPRVGFDYE